MFRLKLCGDYFCFYGSLCPSALVSPTIGGSGEHRHGQIGAEVLSKTPSAEYFKFIWRIWSLRSDLGRNAALEDAMGKRAIKALSAKSKPTSSSFEIKPAKYPRIVRPTRRRVSHCCRSCGGDTAAGTLQPARTDPAVPSQHANTNTLDFIFCNNVALTSPAGATHRKTVPTHPGGGWRRPRDAEVLFLR